MKLKQPTPAQHRENARLSARLWTVTMLTEQAKGVQPDRSGTTTLGRIYWAAYRAELLRLRGIVSGRIPLGPMSARVPR